MFATELTLIIARFLAIGRFAAVAGFLPVARFLIIRPSFSSAAPRVYNGRCAR